MQSSVLCLPSHRENYVRNESIDSSRIQSGPGFFLAHNSRPLIAQQASKELK
jgi:hypothetical protein